MEHLKFHLGKPTQHSKSNFNVTWCEGPLHCWNRPVISCQFVLIVSYSLTKEGFNDFWDFTQEQSSGLWRDPTLTDQDPQLTLFQKYWYLFLLGPGRVVSSAVKSGTFAEGSFSVIVPSPRFRRWEVLHAQFLEEPNFQAYQGTLTKVLQQKWLYFCLWTIFFWHRLLL